VSRSSYVTGVDDVRVRFAPAGFSDPWDAYVKGKVLTPRNAFSKFNIPLLRPAVDVQDMVFSPGSLGGISPASVIATPGNDQISVAIAAPALAPSGWTILKAVAVAIADQDPQSGTLYEMTLGEDLTSTYTIVLAGLSEVLHVVGGYLVWTRPDGLLAYSPSMNTTATPT